MRFSFAASTMRNSILDSRLVSQVTPALRALFDPGDPASLRCFAVLNGDGAGRIWCDDPARPGWGVVQEAGFGSLYLGGNLEASLLNQFINDLIKETNMLLGLWVGDPRFDLCPPAQYDGSVLDFTGRQDSEQFQALLSQVPADCRFCRTDRRLLERSLDRDQNLAIFGSIENALEKGLGLCLLRDGEILSEAFAGPGVDGMIEVGVVTAEAHRGRGYATLTCARLIAACEALGYQTYWNCAKDNLASAALARRLGYRCEREYRLLGWFQEEGENA